MTTLFLYFSFDLFRRFHHRREEWFVQKICAAFVFRGGRGAVKTKVRSLNALRDQIYAVVGGDTVSGPLFVAV